jgi:hypothetical protein
MSKIRKRDFVKRNFTARRDLNRHTDIFKDLKHSVKGGRHGEKVELEQELEEQLAEEDDGEHI